MPSIICKALDCLIHSTSKFCCLCFDLICEEDVIHINDEVATNINGSVNNLSISEILLFILRDEMYEYVTTFQTLCEKCAKTAINSYIFIQTGKQNSEHMLKVLQCFTNSIDYAADDVKESKSLYLSLNLNDFTSKQFYDCTYTQKTPKSVLQRYKCIDNPRHKESMFHLVNSKKDKKEECLKLNHMLLNDKNNLDLIKCKVCLKVFPTLLNLEHHYNKVHSLRKFQCSNCRKKFNSKGHLNVHRKSCHSAVVCTESDKILNNKRSLSVHETTNYTMIICQDCGRMYKSKTSYRRHKELNVCGQENRANPANAKYTCDYCNKKYTQKVSLRVHIQYEHEKYKAHILCEWCGKKFWAPSRLKAHIVKHTKERKFKCDICDNNFVTKEALLYHTRIHTGEKPYECSHCDKKFLSRSRRNDHNKRHHTGIQCDICFTKFNTKTLLQKHKKSCHMECNEAKLKYIDSKTKMNVPKSKSYDFNVEMLRICDNADARSSTNVV